MNNFLNLYTKAISKMPQRYVDEYQKLNALSSVVSQEDMLNQSHRLMNIIWSTFNDPRWISALESIADPVLHEHVILNEDRSIKSNTEVMYCGLMHAPAAKGYHHNYIGGLVKHLIEMFDAWKFCIKPYFLNYLNWSEATLELNNLTDSNVLKLILMHDLHKAHLTFYWSEEKKAFQYGNNAFTQTLSTDSQSISILTKHSVALDPVLLAAHSQAEGGWSKNPGKVTTALSKVVYMLDEFSGSIIAPVNQGTALGNFRPI